MLRKRVADSDGFNTGENESCFVRITIHCNSFGKEMALMLVAIFKENQL